MTTEEHTSNVNAPTLANGIPDAPPRRPRAAKPLTDLAQLIALKAKLLREFDSAVAELSATALELGLGVVQVVQAADGSRDALRPVAVPPGVRKPYPRPVVVKAVTTRKPRTPSADLSDDVGKVHVLLLQNDGGLKSEQIRKELEFSPAHLARVIKLGLSQGLITKAGKLRATVYSAVVSANSDVE